MGFSFVLYRHGPFSFDLRDELTALRADRQLELKVHRHYGPRFVTTNIGKKFRKGFPKTIGRYASDIDFVAGTLGDKNVAELERLATALYVTLNQEGCGSSVEQRAGRLNDLKDHIPFDIAEEAVHEIDGIIEDARSPAN